MTVAWSSIYLSFFSHLPYQWLDLAIAKHFTYLYRHQSLIFLIKCCLSLSISPAADSTSTHRTPPCSSPPAIDLWPLAVMAERSVAPGQTYIEVEYDYEYKSKDRLITIKQGESYLLVKKTNDDWWQVRKDEASKPFYVPAQYVREVRRALMPPPKPLSAGSRGHIRPSGLEIQRPDENKKSPSPSSSSSALMPPRDDRSSPGSPTGQINTLSGSLPHSRAESPSRIVDGGSSDKNRNDSESGDDLSSGSTDNLQVRITCIPTHLSKKSTFISLKPL